MLERFEIREDGIAAIFRGVVTSEELLDACNQFLSRLKEAPYRYQLMCFYDIEDFQVSAAEIRDIAWRDIAAFKQNPVEKIAIVSDSKLIYGLARMYEAFASDSTAETQIFERLNDAEQWLSK